MASAPAFPSARHADDRASNIAARPHVGASGARRLSKELSMPKDYRELRAIVQENRSYMMAGHREFLDTAETEMERMSRSHPADLRRLHGKIVAYAKGIIEQNQGDKFTPEVSAAAEGFFAMADICESTIQAKIDGDAKFGAMNTSNAGGTASGWFNAETGNPVRIFGAHERVNNGQHSDLPTLGAYLHGIMAGPRTPEIRAALSQGTDSAGGYSIPLEVLQPFIDRLRAQTCFIQAGARTLMLDGAKTRIMRIASDPVATWRAENAAVTESAPTFDAIDFAPKSLAVLVKVSQELLADSVNVEDALTTALTAAMALELDRVCFFGSGTGNEPRGLDNLAGVPTITLGAGNGATPDWDVFPDALYEIEVGNGGPMTAVVMHPRTRKTLTKLKDSIGNYRMPPPGFALPNETEGLTGNIGSPQRLTTTAFPIDQTVGTNTDCSTMHAGNFARGILAIRQQLMIRRLDQTFAGNLQVGFLAFLRADVQFEHAASFVKVKGVRP
jgi:HK97 family phage major capsid protein